MDDPSREKDEHFKTQMELMKCHCAKMHRKEKLSLEDVGSLMVLYHLAAKCVHRVKHIPSKDWVSSKMTLQACLMYLNFVALKFYFFRNCEYCKIST